MRREAQVTSIAAGEMEGDDDRDIHRCAFSDAVLSLTRTVLTLHGLIGGLVVDGSGIKTSQAIDKEPATLTMQVLREIVDMALPDKIILAIGASYIAPTVAYHADMDTLGRMDTRRLAVQLAQADTLGHKAGRKAFIVLGASAPIDHSELHVLDLYQPGRPKMHLVQIGDIQNSEWSGVHWHLMRGVFHMQPPTRSI